MNCPTHKCGPHVVAEWRWPCTGCGELQRYRTPTEAWQAICMDCAVKERKMEAKATVVTDAKARKAIPLFLGVLKYFPDALCEVAEVSRIGNEQHNPGQPIHWAKEKSTDEYDALARHLLDVGTRDIDGVRHAAKVAWRALAGLQREIDKEREAAAKQAQYNAQAVGAAQNAANRIGGMGSSAGILGGLFPGIP